MKKQIYLPSAPEYPDYFKQINTTSTSFEVDHSAQNIDILPRIKRNLFEKTNKLPRYINSFAILSATCHV